MKIFKKILEILSYILITILVIIIIIVASVFIQTKISPDKVPTIFGYKPFIVLSGSMETKINEGDLVIVKVTDYSTLKEKDIIAFKSEDGYITTHRIVKIEDVDGEKHYITKGDSNKTEDSGYVVEDNIEGLYVYKFSGLGNVVLIMRKPVTVIAILLILTLLAVIVYLQDKSSMTEEEKDELEKLRQLNSSKRKGRKVVKKNGKKTK